MADSKTFDPKTIYDYYHFTSPADLVGSPQLKNHANKKSGGFRMKPREGATGSTSGPASQPSPNKPETVIKIDNLKNYFCGTCSADAFCSMGNKALGGAESMSPYVFCANQNTNIEATSFVCSTYWSTTVVNPASPPRQATTSSKTITNFYSEVCGQSAKGAGLKVSPSVGLSVNLINTPMLSVANRNTRDIEFYLNYMPNTFVNSLVPYCDVEFQLPKLLTQEERKNNDYNLNRPSLLRFLVGSKVPKNLTEADKSLANIVGTGGRKSGVNSGAKKNGPPPDGYTFLGMEYFTTPQTLSSLMSGADRGFDRETPFKPFLPPASIDSITITVSNAGGAAIGKRNATLNMTIHDRARLPEFSEFIRGSPGYSDVIVWVTYGMLAPRGGPDDGYAKFINETMLVREAFSVSNSTFNFTPEGGVKLVLSMASKVQKKQEFTTISIGDINSEFETANKGLKTLLSQIAGNQNAFGIEREKEKFNPSEIRMASIIQSAAAGGMTPSPNDSKAIEELYTTLNEVEKLLKDPNISVQARSSVEKPFDREKSLELIKDLKTLYGINSYGNNQVAKNPGASYAEVLRKAAVNTINEALKPVNEASSPDPFFPTEEKNKRLGLYKDSLLKVCQEENRRTLASELSQIDHFAPDSYKRLFNDTTGARRQFASFGKIFSVLCIPSILNSVKQEFGVEGNPDFLKNVEVQFNFYQINQGCGPASCINIAEFPLDLVMFQEMLANMISTRGGSDLNLEEMTNFLGSQLSDARQPGYDQRRIWNPYSPNYKEGVPIGRSLNHFTQVVEEWRKENGGNDLIPISLAIDVETFIGNKDGNRSQKVDLLNTIQKRVGAGYTDPLINEPGNDEKIVIRYHIYDRKYSPYSEITRRIGVGKDGEYYLYNANPTSEGAKAAVSGGQTINPEPPGKGNINPRTGAGMEALLDVTYIGKGKQALKTLLQETVPVILPGSNGTLISQITLASKTDSLQGTVALQGGTWKVTPSLTDNGLQQQQFNLPIRVMPAQLTMATLGCPLAFMGQQYFFDFNTNTTIDNVYQLGQVQHQISPGKFVTNWTFNYADGWAQMYVSKDNTFDLVKDLQKAIEQSRK